MLHFRTIVKTRWVVLLLLPHGNNKFVLCMWSAYPLVPVRRPGHGNRTAAKNRRSSRLRPVGFNGRNSFRYECPGTRGRDVVRQLRRTRSALRTKGGDGAAASCKPDVEDTATSDRHCRQIASKRMCSSSVTLEPVPCSSGTRTSSFCTFSNVIYNLLW